MDGLRRTWEAGEQVESKRFVSLHNLQEDPQEWHNRADEFGFDTSPWTEESMKTFYNDPERYVDEMLAGILAAHPGELAAAAGEKRAIMRADAPVKGKVAICTGSGRSMRSRPGSTGWRSTT